MTAPPPNLVAEDANHCAESATVQLNLRRLLAQHPARVYLALMNVTSTTSMGERTARAGRGIRLVMPAVAVRSHKVHAG
jgi:hypothetical protein